MKRRCNLRGGGGGGGGRKKKKKKTKKKRENGKKKVRDCLALLKKRNYKKLNW